MMKEKIDKYLEELKYYYDVPGLTLVMRKGDFAHISSTGYFDYVKKKELEKGNVFHMASLAKLFTSTGILQLEEKGLLSIDDLVIDHLPWLTIKDKRAKEITVKQLLIHTSGMGDVDDYCWDKPRTHKDALKEYALSDQVSNVPFYSNPGDNKFRYSNIAYELLGCLISEKTGMSFEAYMNESIFKPLGMNNSTFLTFERDPSVLVKPHRKDKEKSIVYEEIYPYNREHGPSSTLTLDGEDLLKWGNGVLENKLFSKESYKRIWTPYSLVENNGEHIGLGWFLREDGDYKLMGHEGSDNGFRSSFWVCPEEECFIGVMTNISFGRAKKINKKIFEKFVKEEK